MDSVYKYIQDNKQKWINKLSEAVEIPSVSGDALLRPQVFKMSEFLLKEMESLKITTEIVHPGKQTLDGHLLDLPPVILGKYITDSALKTVLVYGHYDVQPALYSDGWATEPFTLVEIDGKMYGRGSTDDKGPILSWLWTIEAYQALGLKFPVNLIICFEGMEESGSEGLDEIIHHQADKFFKDVDCVCISDNYWLGTNKPCLTYGLRGISYFSLEITGIAKDLHSGVFGGTVHEPMIDLVKLMSGLVGTDSKILIPGIYNSVPDVTTHEESLYANLDFKMDDIFSAIGSKTTIHDSEKHALMARWRLPSLSIHGVEGAFYSSGAKTVIPAKVIGKFSIRTVPNQDPDTINQLVSDHILSEFKKLNSKNQIKVIPHHSGRWWVADPNSWNYRAAAVAVEKVFKTKPDYTREGGSIPVTLTFQEALKKSVLLLPMGKSDDGAHSTNEKLDVFNYIEGIKLLATYLEEIGNAVMD